MMSDPIGLGCEHPDGHWHGASSVGKGLSFLGRSDAHAAHIIKGVRLYFPIGIPES